MEIVHSLMIYCPILYSTQEYPIGSARESVALFFITAPIAQRKLITLRMRSEERPRNLGGVCLYCLPHNCFEACSSLLGEQKDKATAIKMSLERVPSSDSIELDSIPIDLRSRSSNESFNSASR